MNRSALRTYLVLAALAGCTDVDNNTFVQPGVDADGGGESPSNGRKPLTGDSSPGEDGSIEDTDAALIAPEPDGGTEPLSDAGELAPDSGGGAPDSGGPLVCLDDTWAVMGDKCCWGGWKVNPEVPSIQLAGQTSGSFEIDMSMGYGAIKLVPTSKESVLFRPVLEATTYTNGRYSSSMRLQNQQSNWFVVEPKDACDDSLPPGKKLRFTYTVVY